MFSIVFINTIGKLLGTVVVNMCLFELNRNTHPYY